MTSSEQNSIHDFVFHAAAQRNALSLNIFKKEWDFLSNSEAKLISLMDGNELPDSAPGDAEYGLILYWLHQGALALPLKLLGMPPTRVSSSMYELWQTQLEKGSGAVMRNGTLVSTIKFATLDISWANSFLYYLRTRYSKFLPPGILPIKPHDFGTTPQKLALDGTSLTIAILGDWGTGAWPDGECALSPAELVIGAIKKLAPDIVIHLGDVYYSGTDDQEQSGLLKLWSGGTKGSFTLNSNHEMYDGANGYFGTGLADPAFSIQQNTSYFAITFGNWIIFGLDSAYYDQSTLYSKVQ